MPWFDRRACGRRHIKREANGCQAREAAETHHFGRTFGSPPGLPGGGMTGIEPFAEFGAGACICGSMPGGGHSTPSDSDSVSPSGLPASFDGVDGWTLPSLGAARVGAHFVVARSGLEGAVGACGVVGAGAACASAVAGAAVSAQIITARVVDIRIRTERSRCADVPAEN